MRYSPSDHPASRRSVLVAGAVAATAAVVPSAVARPAASHPGARRFSGLFQEVPDRSAVPASARRSYGFTPASVMWFDAWGTGNAFPVEDARRLWAQGVLPHYTWEPWDTALGLDDPAQITLAKIVDGEWDEYVAARGAELAALGSPVIVRFAHEFNGNWYPWAVSQNGEDPTAYVRAFRHVHDLVLAQGADNVQWSWTYNNGPSPSADWNAAELAYPGAGYVDWIGIDGYNWGLGPSWDPTVNHWASFAETIGDAYRLARRIDPSKPVMLGEFASSEDGGRKGRWLREMVLDLRAGMFPNLRLLTYFDVVKEEVWGLTAQAAVVRSIVRSRPSWFSGDGRELATLADGYVPVPE